MKKLDHENVIKLIEVINDEVTDKIYMGTPKPTTSQTSPTNFLNFR